MIKYAYKTGKQNALRRYKLAIEDQTLAAGALGGLLSPIASGVYTGAKNESFLRGLGAAGGAAVTGAVGGAIGAITGAAVDARTDLSPLFTSLGASLGVTAGTGTGAALMHKLLKKEKSDTTKK